MRTAEEIGRQVSELYETHRAVICTGLEKAKEIGELLIAAKKAVGHGGFMAWRKKWCKFSDTAATMYMAVAKRWDLVKASGGFSKAMVQVGRRKPPDERPSLKNASDGDLVELVVAALAERENAAFLISRIEAEVKKARSRQFIPA